MKILVIYNQRSGQNIINKKNIHFKKLKELNHDVKIIQVTKDYGGSDYLLETDVEYDIIIAFGGDGTISTTVDAMIKRKSNAKLIVVPGGSTNEYAQTLEVDFNRFSDSLALIENGITKEIDIGYINDQHFIYVAAFGNFTSVTYDTPQKWKNIFGHAAYWAYGVIKYHTLKNYNYKITIGDEIYDETFLLGFISNASQFGTVFKYKKDSIDLQDGQFEYLFVRKPKKIKDYLELARHLIIHDYSSDLFIKGKSDKILLEAKSKGYNWNLDGEDGGVYQSSEFTVKEKAIKILV